MGSLLSSLLRPLVRIVVGLIAIPLFRLFMRRVVRWDKFDAELTKDIEQWVRGCLLLLLATANVEFALVTSMSSVLHHDVPAEHYDVNQLIDAGPVENMEADPVKEEGGNRTPPKRSRWAWISLALRLLLAMGVIEAMPDQALFAIIHPGPSKLLLPAGRRIQAAREQFWPYCKGLLCRHLDRSSSVLAILSVIIGGKTYVEAGWICYFAACAQFLIIGLVASRDKAIDVLSEFDKAIQGRREELLQEFRQFD
ncbi:MAG: DNA topoisomerase I [Planctomycetota bacterium]|nr:DNA topoisomerase I [Planctomycetota bacterium]